MQSLQETITKQKGSLISSILKLKSKEFNKNPTCSCRGFCFIDHKKYNFHKCAADEIFKKIEQLSNASEIDTCSHVPNSSPLLKYDDNEKTSPNKKNKKKHIKKHDKKVNLNTDKKVKTSWGWVKLS